MCNSVLYSAKFAAGVLPMKLTMSRRVPVKRGLGLGSCFCAFAGANPKGLPCALGAHSSDGI